MKILPDDFVSYTQKVMGGSRFDRFMASFDELPSVSVRVKRGCRLPIGGVDDGRVPWCDEGVYLKHRPQFTLDPLFHAGCYYVQEASSMFLAEVLRQHVDGKVAMLDLCAAPGGKSTLALQTLAEGSVLVSNEPVKTRANVLAENLSKWGNPNVIVTNAYPSDIARTGALFDIVLCDVPCSGEGMFRKDEGAIGEWSVQTVDRLWRLQREIVAEAWKTLRPGVLFVYSTCTFNLRENEENVRWIAEEYDADILPVKISQQWNITASLLEGFDSPVYRFIPGITRGEGLFMAVLRKPDCASLSSGERRRRKGGKETKASDKIDLPWKGWKGLGDGFQYVQVGEKVLALPCSLTPYYNILREGRVRMLKAGVALGTVKGRDLVPDIELALYDNLDTSLFPVFEADHATALAYLRRDAIELSVDMPKGYVLVAHEGHALGFVKNIGNRSNNLYPQEWRIKSSKI